MTDLAYTRFAFELALKSDLHIGVGGWKTLGELRPGAGSDRRETEVAAVQRGADGRPILPGTTLKGVLRADHAARHGRAAADALFGAPKETTWTTDPGGTEVAHSRGGPGRVAFYAASASCPGQAFDDCQLPWWDKNQLTAIATHVAIDRPHGVADDKKLFMTEIVPAGIRFAGEGTIHEPLTAAEKTLVAVLAPLRCGLTFGRSGTAGTGLLALAGDPKLTEIAFDVDAPEGAVRESPPKRLAIPMPTRERPVARRERIALHCAGPFLSHDPHHPRQDRVNRADNVLRALRRDTAAPAVWPETILGALRRHCAWLAVVEDPGDGDDRFRARRFAPPEGAGVLSRPERLFGVPGWRGLVRLRGLRATADGMLDNPGIAGIAIDPFSGAVRDGHLFHAECWIGVKLVFEVVLDRRTDIADREWPDEADLKLFDRLVAEVRRDGLLLGHGANRGFGWFNPVAPDAGGAGRQA